MNGETKELNMMGNKIDAISIMNNKIIDNQINEII